MRKSAVAAYRFMEKNIGKNVTPSELNTALGVGDYASRHIWVLKNKLGCKISTKKDGRNIVAYVLDELPAVTPVEVTRAETKAEKKANPVVKEKVTKTAPVKKPVVTKKFDGKRTVKKTQPVQNSVVSASAVDPDFDAVDVNDFVGSF